MQSVIEHLRSHAPVRAAFYRLVGRTPRGEYTLFPRDNHSVYGIGEAPRGLLPGLYQVFYFDAAGQQIQHARVELNLTEAMASSLGPVEGAGGYRSTSVAEVSPLGSAQLSLPLPSSAVGTAQTELVREQAVHKMTFESDQQKHSFVRDSLYMREAGEALMLNRMMRQEMIELRKQNQLQANEGYADVEKQVAALRLLRQAQKEVMQDLKELPPPPPPPKPDLMPLAQELIGTISTIGKAFIESKSQATAPRAALADSSQMLQSMLVQRLRELEEERLTAAAARSGPRAEKTPVAPVDHSQVLQNPVEQYLPAVEQERQASPERRSGPRAEARQIIPVDGSQVLQNPVGQSPRAIKEERQASPAVRTSPTSITEAERRSLPSLIDFYELPERPESD